jgi:hypothetical protein
MARVLFGIGAFNLREETSYSFRYRRFYAIIRKCAAALGEANHISAARLGIVLYEHPFL